MALRDLLIIGIVLLLAILALRRPWIGIMNWTWLSIMNPHRYSWGFAFSAPIAAIAAASTLIGLLFTKEKQSPFQGAPTVWLFLFSIWITISWLLGYDPSGDYEQWSKVMKIYLMTFISLMLLQNKFHIMAYAWITTGSLAFLAAKGGLFTIITGGGYRVWGPPGSFIADNNHFALATIVAIPMLYFLQLQLQTAWQRRAMTGVILLCVTAALGSQSRGALLALAALGTVFWWRSARKGVIGVALVLIVFLMLPMMPEEWWARMTTISDYEQDASAMGRINAWLVAVEVAKNNFFGGGMSYQHGVYFAIYGVYENTIRAAHSIYFQILGNHGFFGLFLYLMIWFATYYYAGQLRKHSGHHKESKWVRDLGAMAQVSLVGYAAGGAFLSMPYFDLPYNIMVMVVIARVWLKRRAWETDPKMPFLEYAGLRRKPGNSNSRSVAG